MIWHTFEEIKSREPERATRQIVNVLADVAALQREIPIPPQVSTEVDNGERLQQWYGYLRGRFIIVETTTRPEAESVIIYTPFASPPADAGDWSVLLELDGLPSSILLRRVVYVQSRTSERDHIVYRADPRGWDIRIYQGSSENDAAGFLSYLHEDEWNKSCFFGKGDPLGQWGIVQQLAGRENVIGCYPEKDDTLRVAWEMSLKHTESILKVRELAGLAPGRSYSVFRGHIEAER